MQTPQLNIGTHLQTRLALSLVRSWHSSSKASELPNGYNSFFQHKLLVHHLPQTVMYSRQYKADSYVVPNLHKKWGNRGSLLASHLLKVLQTYRLHQKQLTTERPLGVHSRRTSPSPIALFMIFVDTSTSSL